MVMSTEKPLYFYKRLDECNCHGAHASMGRTGVPFHGRMKFKRFEVNAVFSSLDSKSEQWSGMGRGTWRNGATGGDIYDAAWEDTFLQAYVQNLGAMVHSVKNPQYCLQFACNGCRSISHAFCPLGSATGHELYDNAVMYGPGPLKKFLEEFFSPYVHYMTRDPGGSFDGAPPAPSSPSVHDEPCFWDQVCGQFCIDTWDPQPMSFHDNLETFDEHIWLNYLEQQRGKGKSKGKGKCKSATAVRLALGDAAAQPPPPGAGAGLQPPPPPPQPRHEAAAAVPMPPLRPNNGQWPAWEKMTGDNGTASQHSAPLPKEPDAEAGSDACSDTDTDGGGKPLLNLLLQIAVEGAEGSDGKGKSEDDNEAGVPTEIQRNQ